VTTGDRLTPRFRSMDFRDKRVVDLGCNIGYYSFLAGQLGARRVLGLDVGRGVVKVGAGLGRRHGAASVELRVADFLAMEPPETFDVALMIDVIGDNRVRNGRAGKMFDALARFAAPVSVVAIRPVFYVEEHMGVSPGRLRGRYPEAFLDQGRLLFLEWVKAEYGRVWDIQGLTDHDDEQSVAKQMLRFTRKNDP